MESLGEAGNTCRLIITRRNASEVLLLSSGSRWALPRVEVPALCRRAEALTGEAARTWSIDTYCLLATSGPAIGANAAVHCAVLESSRQNDRAPAGSSWMARIATTTHCDAEENQLIADALGEIDSYAQGEKAGPFAKPGWLRELLEWAQQQIAPLGLYLSGSFRQLNASPTFALLRLEAGPHAVWFKATGKPNSHELPVTTALARLLPLYVPRVLGIHRQWNGWLTDEAEGISLEESWDFCDWVRTASELAEFQIASIGKQAELLAAGMKDLRFAVLVGRIDPFVARMAELMAAQEKATPAPLAPSELATLEEALRDACSLLEACGLPDTAGHADFNPGNIFVSQNGCRFLDWAEGYVANPLLTFDYLREHLRRSRAGAAASGARLLAAYLRPWTRSCPTADLRRAAALSPLVAVFAYAVASDAWQSSQQIRDRGLAGFYRSLVRRMFREAATVPERSAACLP